MQKGGMAGTTTFCAITDAEGQSEGAAGDHRFDQVVTGALLNELLHVLFPDSNLNSRHVPTARLQRALGGISSAIGQCSW